MYSWNDKAEFIVTRSFKNHVDNADMVRNIIIDLQQSVLKTHEQVQKKDWSLLFHRVKSGFLFHRLWCGMGVLMCEGGRGGSHSLGL